MGTLRVEFFPLGAGDQQVPVGGFTLSVGTAPTTEPPHVPDAYGALTAFADAIDAPIYLVIADGHPDASVEPRKLVVPGRKERLRCASGWRVSAVLADDVPTVVPQLSWGAFSTLSAMPMPSYRVADLPAASKNPNAVIRITDNPQGQASSNGVNWISEVDGSNLGPGHG